MPSAVQRTRGCTSSEADLLSSTASWQKMAVLRLKLGVCLVSTRSALVAGTEQAQWPSFLCSYSYTFQREHHVLLDFSVMIHCLSHPQV